MKKKAVIIMLAIATINATNAYAGIDSYDMMIDLYSENTMSDYETLESICLRDGGQFEIEYWFDCTCQTVNCQHDEWRKAYVHDSNFKLTDTTVMAQYIKENWNTCNDTVHIVYDIPSNTVARITAADANDPSCAQYGIIYYEYVEGEDEDASEACEGLTDGNMILLNAKNGYSVTYPDANNGEGWDLFKLAEPWFEM